MGDVIARYKLARGFNVLHPMGWDAFGLPAENAAIEKGVHPAAWTYENIATMRAQMKPMGFSIDWSREFATCDPEYYGQQQALFLDMLEAGLVARKAAVVNWDPVDMTVLANEQVIDGKGWRSGAPVERRELTQWFFRISDMAEELLDGDRRARRLAREGAHHAAQLDRQEPRPAVPLRDPRRAGGLRGRSRSSPPGPTRSGARPSPRSRPTIRWRGRSRPTPRSRPSSPSAGGWAPARRSSRPPRSAASTPASGSCTRSTRRWELPVWIANFVLMDYGTGAIFGCPAHDQRDLDFARKYGLPVIDVFAPRRRRRAGRGRGLRAAEGRAGRLPAPGRRRGG